MFVENLIDRLIDALEGADLPGFSVSLPGIGLLGDMVKDLFGNATLAAWVLLTIALWVLARRLRLPAAWTSLLPVGQQRMLGAVADTFGARDGLEPVHKKRLTRWSVASYIVSAVAVITALTVAIGVIIWAVLAFGLSFHDLQDGDAALEALTDILSAGGLVFGLLAFVLVLIALAAAAVMIVLSVYEAFAAWRIFRAAWPKLAILGLMLFIFVRPAGAVMLLILAFRYRPDPVGNEVSDGSTDFGAGDPPDGGIPNGEA